MVGSDNGLILQGRQFQAAYHDYPLRQEFITPSTRRKRTDIVERFFRLADE